MFVWPRLKRNCFRLIGIILSCNDQVAPLSDRVNKKYYDDIFRFIVKACKSFKVQAFITTHSIEAIDGLLGTQDYDIQHELDDICVCTIKRTAEGTVSRVLTGREVYENRESFGFEVRL